MSSISIRESQLAAALDAWDRLPRAERDGSRRDMTPAGIDGAAIAGAASVTAPTPLSDRRRTTSTRWLTGAAAALVLVLVGGIALQLGSRGTDDGSVADSSTSSEALTDRSVGALTNDESAPSDAAAAAELAPTGDGADPAAGADELDTGIDNAAPPGEDAGLDQLRSLTDLADFAATAVGAPLAPDDVPAATSQAGDDDLSEAESVLADAELPICLGVDLIVGPAVYLDVPVVVGIDEGLDVAIAYRAATCAEVARVRLP